MQIQESINAANFLSVGMNASKSANKADNSQTATDFASFLNTNNENNTKVVKPEMKTEVKTDLNKSNDNGNVSAKSEKDVQTMDKTTDKETVKNDAPVKDDNNALNETSDAEAAFVEEESAIKDDDFEQVMEVVGEILQLISTQLDVSPQEVTDVIDNSELNFGDLFDKEGAKTFFLETKGVEVSQVLTDEDLREALQTFVDGIEEIVSDVEVLPEDIDAYLLENEVTLTDVAVVDDKETVISDEISYKAVETKPVVDGLVENKEEVDVSTDSEVVYAKPEEDTTKVVVKDNRNEHERGAKQDNNKSSSADNTASVNKQSGNTNTVLTGIADAFNRVENVEMPTEPVARPTQVVEQIIEQVRVNINVENTSMEMQLYPEHLGRIQIHVVSKDGVMTARIAAENEAAKQAIETGLNNLKEAFNQQNLKVEAVEVTVSMAAFSENDERQADNQDNKSSGKGRRLNISDLDEESVDEIEEQRMEAEGSSVSYRA